ncbi:MAG: ElyC/SanA/YdcF family protein [Candidatus Woesebacteria bacterium]|nr:ElyC/SanA/YdcF family protein [Candidatus Woesebacteria bacterium]
MIRAIESQRREGALVALRGLVEGTPDAFFIFAGAMTYDETKDEYVTASFDTYDENSMLATGVPLPSGGRDRVLATCEMHGVFPEAYFVAMSKTRDGNKPTYASVTRKELLEKGVEDHRILLQDVSVDTVTELKETARLAIEREWSNVVLIVSRWQVPRAEALLNHIEDFADRDEDKLLSSFANAIKTGTLLVQFLDTTTVLSAINDTYTRFFGETLASDPGMLARIRAEAEGVRQIAEGTYGGRMLTHKIWEGKP